MNLRHKRNAISCIAFVTSLILLFSVIPVYAETEESLNDKTSSLQLELSDLNQELLDLSNEIANAQMQIEITNSEILRSQDSIAEAELKESEQYESMKSRIKYMYETGNATLLEMLFSAENMTDFLNKADFIQNISSYDREMLLELSNTRTEIESRQEALLVQQASLVAIQEDLKMRQVELESRARAASVDLAEYEAQLERLRAEEAERARIAAEKAAQEAAAIANANNANNGSQTSVITGSSTSVSASELDLFAAILQCEAKYDYHSMLAVATVIMNRVESSRFPNTITDVIYASGQFEPVWTGRLDTVLAQGPLELSYTVARDAIAGARLASVADCYYFLYAGATNRNGVNIGDNLFFQTW
jgi:peptidoglycan hydrolase CwlO-like protein